MNDINNMTNNSEYLLEAKELKKHFRVSSGIGEKKLLLRAVDGVNFGVRKDSVFAIVGESGCGKSTVARMILRLLDPTSGHIYFKGQDITSLKGDGLHRFRRAAQIIFQDPFASLNPRMRIMDALAEPYGIHKLAPESEIKGRVIELLNRVGLTDEVLHKYPHEFSGGQRQRICIARALSVSPELIVADEPLSSLDVSIQAQILNLLQEIRKAEKVSMVFISHDLRVVRYLSDEVAIMYLGRIVETGKTDDIFHEPKHPYTELLLSSAPKLKYSAPALSLTTPAQAASGDVPTAIDIPPGCPFHPRCPKRFEPCDKIYPESRAAGSTSVACHLY